MVNIIVLAQHHQLAYVRIANSRNEHRTHRYTHTHAVKQ